MLQLDDNITPTNRVDSIPPSPQLSTSENESSNESSTTTSTDEHTTDEPTTNKDCALTMMMDKPINENPFNVSMSQLKD